MVELFLIRKGGYYYRPNAQGYTASVHEAGRYPEAETVAHMMACAPGEITIFPAPVVAASIDVAPEIRTVAEQIVIEHVGSGAVDMDGLATAIAAALETERARAHGSPAPQTNVKDEERYRVARAIVASGVGELSFDQWSEDMQTVFLRQADAAIATIAASPVQHAEAALKAGFELSEKVAWPGGWKEAYCKWNGNSPSHVQHVDPGVTPATQDKIREKSEVSDGRHGPAAAVSRQHPDKTSAAGRDHRHPKAGKRQGEACGGEAGDTGAPAEGTRQGLRSTGAVGQRNLDAPVSHSSEHVTDQTFDLVRSMGAIADGCDSESVMEALGALTIALIVGGAEDRAHAQDMAERFAENIVECVDDAIDQQEGRP